MLKRWIPFGVVCLLTAFIAGLNLGAASEFDQANRQAGQRRLNTTIAVVNADTSLHTGRTKLITVMKT